MKFKTLLPLLLVLVLGQQSLSYSAQSSVCTFQSPLRFKSSQWQIQSALAPVYLARLEAGTWRVLAQFDGTNGKYHLEWENPAMGVYVAMDTLGTFSESLKIGDERQQAAVNQPNPHRCGLATCAWRH
jgi:hypothetical protein